MARTNFREAMQVAGRVDEGYRQTTELQLAGSSLKTRERYEQEVGDG